VRGRENENVKQKSKKYKTKQNAEFHTQKTFNTSLQIFQTVLERERGREREREVLYFSLYRS
jgi:hypothetical protein